MLINRFTANLVKAKLFEYSVFKRNGKLSEIEIE